MNRRRESPCTHPGGPRGWHWRGYLPHLDATGLIQFVTFRVADAVPREVIARWRQELGSDDAAARALLQRRIAHFADAGHGSCPLAEPGNAELVRTALLHFHGERYRLLAWCVMPNHVHVLVQPTDDAWPLPSIVQGWKSWTAKAINRRLQRRGRLWMPDYFDRRVRDDAHLYACVRYIRQNPVKAGLVARETDWRWTGP